MSAPRLISFVEKIVKPNSPTPLSFGRYNLSGLDQLMRPSYMPIAAFYPFPCKKPEQISNILEKSLCRVLSSYYPFAGRLRDNTFIDCNDMGANFINVQYDYPMSEVVNLPDTGLPFPNGLPWSRTLDEESLLVIQLNHFNCGGLAISANLSHKVADGCTLCSFISDWAAITRDHNTTTPSPQLIGSSFYPPSAYINIDTTLDEIDNQSMSRKRYIFPNSKLELLKSLVESETGVQNPTRVEVLSALLYKCATTAARENSSTFKIPVLAQLVNLRPMFDPPLPTRSIGNIFSSILAVTSSENEMTIPKVVRELRKAKEELKKVDHVKENKLLVWLSQWASMADHNIDLYSSSSVCNFPFYNLDFGWGKPNRVLIPSRDVNSFVLMDNQSGDGIEAIVSLPEKVVPEFENSKEFLDYASPVLHFN